MGRFLTPCSRLSPVEGAPPSSGSQLRRIAVTTEEQYSIGRVKSTRRATTRWDQALECPIRQGRSACRRATVLANRCSWNRSNAHPDGLESADYRSQPHQIARQMQHLPRASFQSAPHRQHSAVFDAPGTIWTVSRKRWRAAPGTTLQPTR